MWELIYPNSLDHPQRLDACSRPRGYSFWSLWIQFKLLWISNYVLDCRMVSGFTLTRWKQSASPHSLPTSSLFWTQIREFIHLLVWWRISHGHRFCSNMRRLAESRSYCDLMPHPLRKIAGIRMVYSVPLIIFQDVESGNKSKQWNKHYSCYISNGTIPWQKLESEFHVRFVATSPFASPLEIMQGVRTSIECDLVTFVAILWQYLITNRGAFARPVVSWDCQQNEEVLLRPYALLFPGDNPMQAELCSSAGLCCNHFCQTCKVGGTQKYKQSDEGFSEIFKVHGL